MGTPQTKRGPIAGPVSLKPNALLLNFIVVAAGKLVVTPRWSIRAVELIEERAPRWVCHRESTAGHQVAPIRLAMMHTVERRTRPTVGELVFHGPH